jgi:hypothetical protein
MRGLLKADIIYVESIPRQDEVEAFAISIVKVGAAEKAFPQDAGLARAEAHEDAIV